MARSSGGIHSGNVKRSVTSFNYFLPFENWSRISLMFEGKSPISERVFASDRTGKSFKELIFFESHGHNLAATVLCVPYSLDSACTRFDLGRTLALCSDSEAGSYLRLIDCVHHSTLGLRVHPRSFVGVSQSQFFRDLVNFWR